MINLRLQASMLPYASPWQARSKADRATAALERYSRAKRLLDIALAGALLVLLSPLMLAISLAIVIDSSGPVIYVQRRGGLHGRLFKFYKFRSMTSGHDHTQEHRRFAEAYINGQSGAHLLGADGKPLFKPVTNGHTVTRVGAWLRKTSLDELPQLVNILKGDMSLVGPRPSIDYEVAMYTDRHRQRLEVLPGLTGWAQINGRSSLGFEEIVSLDLEYIERRSLRKDLSILLSTIPVALSSADAA